MSDLDELPRRLDGLQSDLTSMRLRPADGVRRRAAQRSRRQTAVATIGTLAVAGVLGVAALQLLPGANRAEPPPPAASSTAPVVVSPPVTPTPTPSLTPTSSALLDPAEALLPPSALPRTLPKIDSVWSQPGRSTDGSYWEQETSHVMLARNCWSRPVAQPRQEIVGTYGSDYMADAVEVVALAADDQAAADAFDRLRQRCLAEASAAGATIPPGGGVIVRVTDLSGADLTGDEQGFELTEDAEENGEVGAHLLTVLRRGDRIVMLLFRDVSAVSDLNRAALRAAALEAMDRVTSP